MQRTTDTRRLVSGIGSSDPSVPVFSTGDSARTILHSFRLFNLSAAEKAEVHVWAGAAQTDTYKIDQLVLEVNQPYDAVTRSIVLNAGDSVWFQAPDGQVSYRLDGSTLLDET